MDDLQGLTKKGGFQVFLLASPSSVPINFALHHWFVINKQGSLSRWEVLFRKVQHKTNWGHLYMNFYPSLFQGVEIIPFYQKYFWKGRLLGEVEGEAAKRAANFIENSPKTYPYCYKYFPTGPNSNTYTQWVLNHLPEFNVKLPLNSFGKDYKVAD